MVFRFFCVTKLHFDWQLRLFSPPVALIYLRSLHIDEMYNLPGGLFALCGLSLFIDINKCFKNGF